MTEIPTVALSPGERLRHTLEERGMKQRELALLLGRSAQYVQDILNGKKNMDARLAVELEDALGTPSASQWLEYELEYQRQQMSHGTDAQASGNLKRRDVVAQHPYLLEGIKFGWFEDSRDPNTLLENVERFRASAPQAAISYRTSPAHKLVRQNLEAWSIQSYLQASQKQAEKYDEERFEDLVAELRALMSEEDGVAHVESTLSKYGIRFVIVPNLKKTPVDGIASLNDGKPYVGLSLRHGQLDRFWFVLMHELAHIYLKHKDGEMTFDSHDQVNDTKLEDEADTTAQEWILPREDYDDFVSVYDFSLPAIKEFAAEQGLHYSIVLGRLKRDGFVAWHKHAREHPSIRDNLAKA